MLCGAVERHRLTRRVFDDKTSLVDGQGKKMLHVGTGIFPGPETHRATAVLEKCKHLLSRHVRISNPCKHPPVIHFYGRHRLVPMVRIHPRR